MLTTSDYLTQLQADKATLKNNLETKGIEVLDTDTFTEMSSKVADIPSGGDIDEYIDPIINKDTNMYDDIPTQILIKLDSIKITNNVKSLMNACYQSKAKSITFSKDSDTTNVTSFQEMFIGCHDLTELDISVFDTSKATSIYGMFRGCYKLPKIDLSNFNTSNVTNMGYMFQSCSSLTEINLSNFDTSKVTTMASMFSGASGLTSLDLKNFNTSNVTDMSAMFSGVSKLTNLDLSNFDTSEVTTMAAMFWSLVNLTHLDIRNFTFDNVRTYTNMFGTNSDSYIPADCEIIVKSETEKEWITSKFSRLANVKTVAEYETEQEA